MEDEDWFDLYVLQSKIGNRAPQDYCSHLLGGWIPLLMISSMVSLEA